MQFDVEMILKLTPESGFDKFRSNLHLHRVKAYSISLNGCPKAIEDATGAIKLNHAADIRQIYREILGDCYVQVGEIPKAVEVYRESWMVEKMGRNDRSAAEMKRKLAEAEQLLQWTLYATNTEPNNKAPANMDYIGELGVILIPFNKHSYLNFILSLFRCANAGEKIRQRQGQDKEHAQKSNQRTSLSIITAQSCIHPL